MSHITICEASHTRRHHAMKTLTRIALLTLLFTLLCGSCSTPHMEEQWNTIEGLMNDRPDSALTLLQAIDPNPLSRGHRAHHALLLSQALDKNYIDLTGDSIITVAVDYYKAYGPQEKLGMALFYLSRVRENAGAIEEAIQYSIEAQQSLAHSNDYNMRALIYGNRADLYKLQYRFEEAIELDRQAIDLYRKSGNYSNIINTHLAISDCYDANGQQDSALNEINCARELASTIGDDESQFAVENYLASFYATHHAYDKAIAILRKAIEDYPQHTLDANDYHLLARIYYYTCNYDSALFYLDNHYAPLIHTQPYLYTLQLFKSFIYRDMGNYAQAYEHLSQYIDQKTETGLLEQNKSIQELEEKYKSQILNDKNVMLSNQIVLLCIIVALLITIATLFIILYIRQRKERIAQYYQLHEEASQNYQSLLLQYNEVKKRLSDYANDRLLLNNALEQRLNILSTLLELSDIYESRKNIFYDRCRNYFDICSDNKETFFDDLKDITNQYCGCNIVEILQKDNARITHDEINLCCLILLGFNNNHIRILFNHEHTQSVFSKRSRLRKKLNIHPDQSLEEFLHGLCKKISQ